MGDDWTGHLYDAYGAMVLRRAWALLGDETAAWDVLQEVFIRALKHRTRFRRQSSPTTWLYRITTNYCFNVLRDSNRRSQRLRDATPLAPATVDADLPDVRLAIGELLQRVPPELCEIAVYHHVDRMTHDEIAEVMGVSRRTIGNRLQDFQSRARAAVGDSVDRSVPITSKATR